MRTTRGAALPVSSPTSLGWAKNWKKVTFEPARKFGLLSHDGKPGRGEIKEGNYADLVAFKGGDAKFTVVNGKVVMKAGEFQNRFPGKALRHQG